MADLQAYVATFNCARNKIDTDFFAAHFLDGLQPALPPDLVVLCLQEFAPIAYSFITQSMIVPYISLFHDAVLAALKKQFGTSVAEEYSLLTFRHVGMTAIIILTRHDTHERIRAIDTAGVGVGLWEMGNKGAVGVRLWLAQGDDGEELVPLTFVAAHLAPMEEAWQRRNEDWKSICERLVFTPDPALTPARRSSGSEDEPLLSSDTHHPPTRSEEQSLLSPESWLFFAGDLNYRTSDLKPHPDDHIDWPTPTDEPSDQQRFASMLELDQLNRERLAGRTFHNLTEAPIKFTPTYKVSSHAQQEAVSLVKHDGGLNTSDKSFWAKHRKPSWCDRILYLADAKPHVHTYVVLPVQPTSDHRPVALSASIPLKQLHAAENPRLPFSVDKAWRAKRVVARRYELVVGIAAYLTLTYDGNALLVGTIFGIVGGFFVLRGLIAP